MTTTIIAIILLIAIALFGLCIAELKGKYCNYENSEAEETVLNNVSEQVKMNGFSELGIKDVIATISTKGFQA